MIVPPFEHQCVTTPKIWTIQDFFLRPSFLLRLFYTKHFWDRIRDYFDTKYFWDRTQNKWLGPQSHSMVMVLRCQNHRKTIEVNWWPEVEKTLIIPSLWKSQGISRESDGWTAFIPRFHSARTGPSSHLMGRPAGLGTDQLNPSQTGRHPFKQPELETTVGLWAPGWAWNRLLYLWLFSLYCSYFYCSHFKTWEMN